MYILKLDIVLIIIKISLFITFISLLVIFNSKIKNIIYLDNYLKEEFFEKDENFSNYSTQVKPIAIYKPKKKLFYTKIKSKNPEDRLSEKKTDFLFNDFSKEFQNLLNEINIAKRHGIYGFAIYYYFFNNFLIYNVPLEIFYQNPNLNFNYFIIAKNYRLPNSNFLRQEIYDSNGYINIIKSIYKYFLDKRYIKINKSPILGIYNKSHKVILKFISFFKKYLNSINANKIFILNFYEEIKPIVDKAFDGYVYIPSYKDARFGYIYNEIKYYSYSEIYLYNQLNKNKLKTFGCAIFGEKEGEIGKKIFYDYTPYKFYLLNKILINYTSKNLSNNFFFINSFNKLINKKQLNEFGYSSINSLSKAIFNLSFYAHNYKLNNLKNRCKVAIQVHLFFIDLLNEIIDKLKNIHIKYDLYITTTKEKSGKNYITKEIKKYLKPNFFELLVLKNKGRDVIPFLYQIKRVYKKYKYICHIHSKKTRFAKGLGNFWRTYLYNNLLGSPDIVNEILYKFETNKKLGFYFPETYMMVRKNSLKIKSQNKKLIDFVIGLIFPKKKVDSYKNFPSGNMFWGRISAIYQIFEKFDMILNYCPEEKGQKDETILHAIERIWLSLVKYNGYYYTNMCMSF